MIIENERSCLFNNGVQDPETVRCRHMQGLLRLFNFKILRLDIFLDGHSASLSFLDLTKLTYLGLFGLDLAHGFFLK